MPKPEDKNLFTVTGDGLADLGQQIFDPSAWGDKQTTANARGISPVQQRLAAQNASMQPGLLAGANATGHANPYSNIIANQARPAQEALYAQMRAQQAGPSIAGMQGARAQGQSLQAALGTGGGRGTMMQAGGIGAGLAGDTGAGVLAEQLRMSQGLGNMTAGVRGADLGVSQQESQAGLQQRGLDDAMRQFYATQGASLNDATRNADLEYFKLLKRLQAKNTATAAQTGKDAAQAGATALDIII